MTTLAFFGLPGWQELLIVGGLALLIFRRRIPGIGRCIGQAAVEFKRGLHDNTSAEDAAPDRRSP